MTFRALPSILVLAILFVAGQAGATGFDPPRHSIRKLESNRLDHCNGVAINDRGVVVGSNDHWKGPLLGQAWFPNVEEPHVFRTEPGFFIAPSSVNDTNYVVGARTGLDGVQAWYPALVKPDGTVRDLQPSMPEGTEGFALGINDGNDIIGYFFHLDGSPPGTLGYIWNEATGWTNLGNLDPRNPFANPLAINEARRVVGYSNSGPSTPHAFSWTPDEGMVDLATHLPPGAQYSQAVALNDKDQILIQSYYAGQSFIWDTHSQALSTLPGPPGAQISAAGINNSSVVVGAVGGTSLCLEAQSIDCASAWYSTPDGWKWANLNDLVDWPEALKPHALGVARSINASGQILAQAQTGRYAMCYVLTPVP